MGLSNYELSKNALKWDENGNFTLYISKYDILIIVNNKALMCTL